MHDGCIVLFAGVKGENYIENTINVHRFSFIAKKSLHSLKVRRQADDCLDFDR